MDTIGELKPCPFCGSSAVAVVGSFVRCGSCGAVGPYGFTEMEAAERWNERSIVQVGTILRTASAVATNELETA